jgi:hypothetical protein
MLKLIRYANKNGSFCANHDSLKGQYEKKYNEKTLGQSRRKASLGHKGFVEASFSLAIMFISSIL